MPELAPAAALPVAAAVAQLELTNTTDSAPHRYPMARLFFLGLRCRVA